MKTFSRASLFLGVSILATSSIFAQATSTGMFGDLKRQFFGERKEDRKDFRQERKEDFKDMKAEMKDAREDLRKGIQERRNFITSTTASTTASGTTPWKDFRKDVKDIRKDFITDRKEDVKNFKEDKMKDLQIFGAGLLQNATVTNLLAQKLGTTTSALLQMNASGTLQAFINSKVTKGEMEKFLPKNLFGTTTKMFATNTPVTLTITQGTTTFSTTTLPLVGGFKGFFQRFFGR
jgi:hypothetical protein